ncbi:hypothetical protein PFISCL1PPCAC_10327, partial [Pristionchus fissidentatus]
FSLTILASLCSGSIILPASIDSSCLCSLDLPYSPIRLETEQMTSPYGEMDGMEEARLRPSLPPKPAIDPVRYSMIHVKESTDCQLDALLAELEQLGSALDSPNMADQLLLGMGTVGGGNNRGGGCMPSSSSSSLSTIHPPPPVVAPKPTPASSHASQVQHRSIPSSASSSSSNTTMVVASSSCSSPDGDSAFGEGSSTEGKERCRHSGISSSDSLHTPSPTQISPSSHQSSSEVVDEDSKEAKIRQALLKMREANHTRIFVKFFVDDGSPLQMLIDERWSVGETMRQLAEKHHISLSEDHCVVEEFPELYIRRIYEDDENLVENIKMWVEGSGNKLYLTRRPDKYSFVDRPEIYLVTEKTANHMEVPKGEHWPIEVKRQFVQDFFTCDPLVPPELEGWMYLKGDGKKVWKKTYFVLRPSGLYYSSKGKKCTKDLQCLMNFHSNQIYTGFDWKKKYKAPTAYCISLKLTQLQMKRSSYIKYICAEDEMTYKKWLTGLRIAKNGRQVYDSYVSATERRLASMSANVPRRVEVPRVDNERRLDCSSLCSSSSRHDGLSMGGTSSYGASSRAASHRQLDVDCTSVHSGGERTGTLHTIHSPTTHSQTPSVLSGSLSSLRELHPHPAHLDATPRVPLREYEEDLTGTIKRAPLQVTDVLRRSASSCVEEEDSDEESLPAPPPSSLSTTHPSSLPSRASPLPPPKPPLILGTPGGAGGGGVPPPPVRVTPIRDEYATIQKKAPPPPPKRSDGTRLTTMAVGSPATPNMNELEAALRRRQQKMGAL